MQVSLQLSGRRLWREVRRVPWMLWICVLGTISWQERLQGKGVQEGWDFSQCKLTGGADTIHSYEGEKWKPP